MVVGLGVSWCRQENEKRRFSIFIFLSLGESLCE